MPCQCKQGFQSWRSNLVQLSKEKEFFGIEKLARVFLYFLRFFSLSEWLSFCITGSRETSQDHIRDLLIVDAYVAAKTIVVVVLVWVVPERYLSAAAWIACYLLIETFIALFNIVFVTTRPNERPISIGRSLILLILNVVELIATFAILYQAVLLVEPWRAVVFSFDVFGTVGRPSSSQYPLSDVLVVSQIAVDFLFLAIVLAHFLNLRGKPKAMH